MRESLYFQLPVTFQSGCHHSTTLAFSVREVGEMSASPSEHERPALCRSIAGVAPRSSRPSLAPSSALVWDSA